MNSLSRQNLKGTVRTPKRFCIGIDPWGCSKFTPIYNPDYVFIFLLNTNMWLHIDFFKAKLFLFKLADRLNDGFHLLAPAEASARA